VDFNGCVGELKEGKKPQYDLTTPGFVDPPGIAGGVEGKDATVNTFQQCPQGIVGEFWALAAGIPHPPFFSTVGPMDSRHLRGKAGISAKA
jgi:hypothetical protein